MSQINCGAYLCFSEGWFSDARNQAMRFGDLPSWAVELSALIHEAICFGDVRVGCGLELKNEDEDACPLPSDLLWRKPLFDQMIANRYEPGHLCSCWSDALWWWNRDSLPWVTMRDALQSGRTRSSYLWDTGECACWTYKDPCLPEPRVPCSHVRRREILMETWDKPQARCSAMGWQGAWAADKNFNYTEEAPSITKLIPAEQLSGNFSSFFVPSHLYCHRVHLLFEMLMLTRLWSNLGT